MAKSNKVTIYRIAKQLGVSDTAVSLVLSGRAKRYRISQATIRRVEQAAREQGCQPSLPARQLAGKRSNAVGVLINTEAAADVRLIQAMEMLAAARGVRFIVGHAVGTQEKVREYLDDFQARGVDAVISIFHNHPDYSETVLAALRRFEHVVFYEKPGDAFGPDAFYVQPDYFETGRLGVQHLIDRGRKRIGLVLSNLVFPYAIQRRQAYEAAISDAGHGVDEGLIWILDERTPEHWNASFTPELALQAVDALVQREVDGIVAVNDLYAARLLGALRERGRRVPEDVALVGCDNLEISTLTTPTLTTLGFDVDQLAERMIERLFAGLGDGDMRQDERAAIVRPELVIRNST